MLRVSVVIPTRDRSKDLANLLLTIFNQSCLPFEVIIVDDSSVCSTKQVVNSFSSKFKSVGCKLKYVKGSKDGLPAARNFGVKIAKGDAILFLDDDTLLGRNVVSALATFLSDNLTSVGVQPKILYSLGNISEGGLSEKFDNAVYKALMLVYYDKNKLTVRRSGASVLPNNLTKVISVQRFSGCCCCYRRRVTYESSFDTNLKLWAHMEDLDFSYRVYKKNPQSLYVIPHAKIVHRASGEARLPTKLSVYMTTIYWFYVFFKDVFENSIINLMAFLWALIGNLVINVGKLIIERKPKREWWTFIYLFGSYATALRNLKNIRTARLEFFNNNLDRWKEKIVRVNKTMS